MSGLVRHGQRRPCAYPRAADMPPEIADELETAVFAARACREVAEALAAARRRGAPAREVVVFARMLDWLEYGGGRGGWWR